MIKLEQFVFGISFYLVTIFACFIPPLAVLLFDGSSKLILINVLLTLLGYLPGYFHAVYILLFMKLEANWIFSME